MPDPTIVCTDMNPADIIHDIVTHTRYGGRIDEATWLGLPSFAACWNYWDTENMLLSIVVNDSRPWQDWIDYVLSHCDGYRFTSGGRLHLGVLKSETPVDDITWDDIVQPDPDAENPPPKIKIGKRPYSDTFNRIEVSWSDRSNKYDLSVAVAYDPVDQARSGKIKTKQVKLLGIKNSAFAQRMAYRFLIDALYRFSIYTFTLSYSKQLLETGDVITISDNDLLSNQKVRIMNVSEDEHGRGLVITAVDDYAELYPSIGFTNQGSLVTPATAVTLADASITFRESLDQGKLYLSIVPGNDQVNGWYVYRSYDDASFSMVGRGSISGVTGGAANSSGTTLGSLPEHGSSTWAPDEYLDVSIGTVTDLASVTTEDEFWHDHKLAQVGSEIIGYKTATETSPGIWRISNLRRGLFSTEPVGHASGETFATLDTTFTYSIDPADDPADIGATLYFKVVTYYGNNIQDVASVSSYSVTIGGDNQRPAAASLLRLTSDQNDGGSGEYTGATFDLFWNLGGDKSGYNVGPYDVSGGGVPYNNYVADSLLQAIVLKFETEPLIAHYKLNDNMQNVRVVDSQRTSDGTLAGGNNTADVSIAGLIARAFDFDGAHYVDTNASFQEIFRDSCSISIWVKPEDGRPSAEQQFFGVHDTSGADSYFLFRLMNTGKIDFAYMSEGNGGTTPAQTASAVFANGPAAYWSNLVIVLDSTIGGIGGKKIFVNGVEATLDPTWNGSTAGVVCADFTCDDNLVIGGRNTDSISYAYFFTGGIDDVRIYRGALTLAQIQALYNNGKGTEQTRPSSLFAGSAIGQREVAVGESATITKATDLGGNSPAVIRVVPRRVLESKLQNKITVAQV
jgi:hypothetical protein